MIRKRLAETDPRDALAVWLKRNTEPVIKTPVFKTPFGHIAVAFIVDIPEYSVHDNEISGIIVNIQSGIVCQLCHFTGLRDPGGSITELTDNRSVYILLDNTFVFIIIIKHFGDTDPCGSQSPVIIQLRFHFIAEGIIAAGLMMYLLYYDFTGVVLGKVGITAFTVPQKA